MGDDVIEVSIFELISFPNMGSNDLLTIISALPHNRPLPDN